MMFTFFGILCPLFFVYITVLSYLFLFAFNGFWPPSIISVCNQIFDELREAPVNDTIDKWGKLKNVAFQNFHSIYLFIIMLLLFIAHIHQSMAFSNESLIVIAVLANLIIWYLFAPSTFSMPFKLLNVFLDDTETSGTTINPPESK